MDREKTEKSSKKGEIGLIIKHVDNPEIVDIFLRKFSEAHAETTICSEFYNGEVKLWFKVEDVVMKSKLVGELEKAGFHVGDSREDITGKI